MKLTLMEVSDYRSMEVNFEKKGDRCCSFNQIKVRSEYREKKEKKLRIKGVVNGVRLHANVSTEFVLEHILTFAMSLPIF